MKTFEVNKEKAIDERLKKIANGSRYSFAELKTIMDLILEEKTEEAFDILEATIVVATRYNEDLQAGLRILKNENPQS